MSNDPKQHTGGESSVSGESTRYEEPGNTADPKRASEEELEGSEQSDEPSEKEEVEG